METEAQFGNPQSSEKRDLAFLLDVDNTLLDNDALKAEIGHRIEALVGPEPARRFWVLYEEVRQEQDFVDYPETLRRFVHEYWELAKPQQLQEIFDSLPFSSFLYPGVLETLEHLRSLGTAVILSDGDQVFQPLKIRRSGLEDAVGANVLIYVHKEHELPRVFARYPADHYVVVDDKSRILSALEQDNPSTFITVFVLQGHYAHEGATEPAPDFVIHHISELCSFTKERFLQGKENRTSTR
jgi:FMN phosphatase YigB (HAD superfamily)